MSRNDHGLKVWILGLHHSGTTIFWRSFRRDARLLCFDEPLSGSVGGLFPEFRDHQTEYQELFAAEPKRFWDLYQTVTSWQELDATLTEGQRRYLRYLVDQGDNVVIDETHLQARAGAVHALTPDAYVIHLYRRASSFVTSHLLPSIRSKVSLKLLARYRLGHEYRKFRFWRTPTIPSGMRRDSVVGNHPLSKFGLLLSDCGYDAGRIMRSPAVVRLLAYWHWHYHKLSREGPECFGSRFRNLAYETFAEDPEGTMNSLYKWFGLEAPPQLRYPDVYPPKRPFRQGDPRWREAARIAGFTEEEIGTLL